MSAMGWWDWVGVAGFAIGVVAFLMAVHPFTQAIWGKPRIIIETAAGDLGNEHPYLEFVISNKPIEGGILGVLGVTRDTVVEMFAMIRITEYQTERVVVPSFMPKLVKHGTGADGTQRIALPPSIFGAKAAVIIRGDGGVIAATEGTPKLDSGEFVANIVIIGTKKPKRFSARFTINPTGTFYWL